MGRVPWAKRLLFALGISYSIMKVQFSRNILLPAMNIECVLVLANETLIFNSLIRTQLSAVLSD